MNMSSNRDLVVGPRGIVLDQYPLIEKLSNSRTGLIFKARHRLLGRIVAVKFLSDEAAASKMLTARFHRAIQILARLEHRNLVEAFEAGEQDGIHYLVMEYVDGQDLRSIIKEKKAPFGVEEAVRYTIQAAAGLAAAHEQGICHRNIKPGNLLVDREGVIKVVGFALAHVEAGGAASEAGVEDNLTRQGQVIGTYEYMSPEQAMDSSSVDRRADIYSLGCTLHMLLTGKPPYVANVGMAQVLAHRMQPIPSLRQTRPEIPESLDRVFQKMLAKTPGGRYASMEEVMADLEASLSAPTAGAETTADNLRAVIGLPSGPARSGDGDKVVSKPRAAKRGPRMVPIVVGGVLGVLAFVFAVQYSQDKKSPEVARSMAPRKTEEPPAVKPATKPESAQIEPLTPSKDTPSESTPMQPAPDTKAVENLVEPAKEDRPESKPEPVPNPEPQPQPTPQPTPKPAPKPEASPVPVPDEAARRRASKQVGDMFQEEIERARSGMEKSALARKILRQAINLNDDPAGRYVMLETCCSLAKEAVDASVAMEVLDTTSRYYVVDAWSTKANMLANFAEVARNSLHHGALAQQTSNLAQKAIEAGQFEIAAKMCELAVAEAGKSRDPKASTRIFAMVKKIEKAVAMHREYEAAKAILQNDPQNPEANLTAGRYECLIVGNWNQGLRELTAGSDDMLRMLAAKDLAEPKDPEEQASIGDGWRKLAREESGTVQIQFYRRAALWYEKALPSASGLLKLNIEKQLHTIQATKTISGNP